jgi:hypothetical protein
MRAEDQPLSEEAYARSLWMIPCNDIGSTIVNATIGKGESWMAERQSGRSALTRRDEQYPTMCP